MSCVLSCLVRSGLDWSVLVGQVASRFCAFVTFTERAAAEKAAEALHNKLMIKGVRLRLMWGRGGQAGGRNQPQPHDPMQPIPSGKGPAGGAAGGPPPQAAMAAAAAQHNFFGLPAEGAAGGLYPSMDPSAQGSAMKRPGEQPDGGQADKRQRGSGGPTGYGAPPPMPPPGMPMPPPHMMMPPPGYGMPPPMGMFPPPAGFGVGPPRPPMGAPPPAAAAGPGAPPPAAAPAAAAEGAS